MTDNMTTQNYGHAASVMRLAEIIPTSALKGRLFLTLLMMLLTTMTAWAETVTTYYVDADGTRHDNITATVLTSGGATTLSAGWYVVNSDITYTGTVTLDGDVNIILANEAHMNIGTSNSIVTGSGINGLNSSLTIYGQSLDEGTAGQLSIYISSTFSNDACIYIFSGTYTQHSGNVTINSFSNNAINVYGDITINGGKLDATATAEQWNSNDVTALACSNNITMTGGILNATGRTSRSSYSANGIHGTVTMTGGTLTASGTAEDNNSIGIEGNVTFSGGTLTASATSTGSTTGISGDVSLSWTSPTDCFTASSYNDHSTITIADGKAFYNGSEVLSGTITDMSKLDGKTLTPAVVLADNTSSIATAATVCAGDKTLAVQLSGRTLYKDGKWKTLCLPFNVTIAGSPLSGDNVEAMVLDGEDSGLSGTTLTLNFEDAPATIPAGTPFIIRWGTPQDNPGTTLTDPVFNGVTVSDDTNDVDFTGGSFKGTYEKMAFAEENKSILFVGADNNLHWPLSGASLGACRAYFELADGSPAHEFVQNFGDGSEEMGISPAEIKEITEKAGAWYTINGVRLNSKPTKKGLYIHNGRKVVIK